ncbi:MAG: ABC transporter ATP-binding protein [Candidatus Latescibacteria bacterium]|jgi:ABC-type multidrug transport system fused ATPase/permease subunit|nr:ABC transporter ATP-binding protein [Candidatus Latescibacterota bacterium]
MSLSTVRQVFWDIIWPRRSLILLGLALIIINRIAGLVLPGSTKYLIDDVIVNKDTALLEMIILAVGSAILFQAITGFALTRLLSVEAQSLIAQLRGQLQKHIIHLPTRYFDNTRSGELVSRIMSDVEGVRNLVGTGLVQLIGGILTSIVSFLILLNINVLLTLVSLVPLVLFSLISLQAFKRIRPIFRERGKANAEVTGRLTEALNGIRVIKGFHAEKREERVFEEGVDSIFQIVKRSLTMTALVTGLATLLMGVASVGLMWFGGNRIIEDVMTVGDFFAFTLYLGFMIGPIIQMSNIGSQMTEAFAGLDRMEEVLGQEPEGTEPSRVHALDSIDGNITFENVSFSYEEGKMVVKDASFEASAGSVTAFVGSSGSGKTTMAGLAASFLKPDSGTVRVDGVDLATIRLDSYRQYLGVVLQDEFLFEGTIRENILFPRPEATESEVESAIAAAHVKEFTDRFDEGLETVIGERGVKLSGGQRQRVAIARALLADPRVLILDEATSNLDTESESYIQESLSHLMEGRTTFVIAHRLSTIRRADQILVIEDGQIVEQGVHDSLIASEGRYHRLYTYQARI